MAETELLDAAAEVLRGAGHGEHERNEYGRTITPGWRIYPCDDDEVRVEHAMPPDIVGDPNRITSDERYLARRDQRDAYAAAFTAAGWAVRTKTVFGNRSILFARQPRTGEADGG